MEFTLLGAAAVGVAGLWVGLWWEAKRGNAAAECAGDLWDMAIAAIVAGLVVGRVWALVAEGGNPLTRPQDLIILRAGVATGPAAAAALATAAWLGRPHGIRLVADALAPSALLGLAGWHAGCLVREACLGTVSDLPWAMAQAGSSVTRHPVALYTAGMLAVAAIVVALWKQRGPWPAAGVIGSLGLATAAGIRLVTEPLRASLGSGPTAWYVAGLVAGGAMMAWSAVRRHRLALHGDPP